MFNGSKLVFKAILAGLCPSPSLPIYFWSPLFFMLFLGHWIAPSPFIWTLTPPPPHLNATLEALLNLHVCHRGRCCQQTVSVLVFLILWNEKFWKLCLIMQFFCDCVKSFSKCPQFFSFERKIESLSLLRSRLLVFHASPCHQIDLRVLSVEKSVW